MIKHLQIVIVPGWGFSLGRAEYYGRKFGFHIGPFLIFVWQMSDDALEKWHDEMMGRRALHKAK